MVANDRPHRLDSLTSLPAGTTRVQIRYTALSLSSSDRIRFRYRLEGIDTAWVDAGTRRTAFYTNLSPGPYRFQVDASGEDGSWQAAPVAWSFSVEPAFYQTRWFSAMVAAAGLLVVWGAWRVRLRLVRQQFSLALAERARLSREIHDTLLQSLVGVALQFDAIAENLDSASVTAKEQLLRVRRHVEAYVRDARQSISDLRSPLLEATDLATVLRRVRQAVGQRHAHPVRVVGDRDAARVLAQDRQRAAAHRAGGDHQRRPAFGGVADRARAAVRERRRDAAGLGRRPRLRVSLCPTLSPTGTTG